MIPPYKFLGSIGTTSFINSPIPQILLIFVTLIGWLLPIPPLILQLAAKNLPLVVLCFSVIITNLARFLNAMLWPSADISHWWDGRIFCDIQVFLINFVSLAITGSIVCLFRQLCEFLNPDYAILDRTEASKWWTKIFERTLCTVLPLLRASLFYIIAYNRYFILGLHGCTPIADASWPTIALFTAWPVVFVILTLLYAVTALTMTIKHRSKMGDHVSRNKSRITRLSIFCAISVFVYTPYVLYNFARTLPVPFEPFSWSRVHYPGWWDSIYAIRLIEALVIPDYCQVIFSVVVFVCFGAGRDAREQYRELGEKFVFGSKMLWRTIDDRFVHSWRWRR